MFEARLGALEAENATLGNEHVAARAHASMLDSYHSWAPNQES